MIVEYDINCFNRTLKIDIIEWWKEEYKDYPIIKDMHHYIHDALDEYYVDWFEDLKCQCTPLEEYMKQRFEEDYGKLWSRWESVDWDEE